MGLKIGFFSDFDTRASGYFNISTNLCKGLIEKGCEVKAVGLGYRGEEHNYPFGIIPAGDLTQCAAIIQNLGNLWQMDVLIVALDIPIQEQFLRVLGNRTYKYVGIFPIEAPPLCTTWAIALMSMDKHFIISKFGTDEANRLGIPSVHLPVGIDVESWRVPEADEKKKIRSSMLGVDEDCFVVITVADNQERKNLAAAMEVYSDFIQEYPNSRYIMVTREHNLIGWKLRDYASELDDLASYPHHVEKINDRLMIFERGISFKELWSLYAASDVFVLPSKTEGLGMPLLEAMATGVLSVATDCTGMSESLSDGRGILVPVEYAHRDPFGNGMRWWIQKEGLLDALKLAHDSDFSEVRKSARSYVETLKWENAVNVLYDELKEYENGKTTSQ